jgi:hypothetical protein
MILKSHMLNMPSSLDQPNLLQADRVRDEIGVG